MSSSTAQEEKDKGNAAFKAGDFPTAIGHYTAAILADPANPTFPLNRAAAYLKLGKNEDAERDCDAVLKLDRANVKALFRRGQARAALQKLREAEADFRHAKRLEPANTAVKQELKKVEEALQRLSKKPQARTPLEVPPAPQAGPSSSKPAPKRRRVPITIVEPEHMTSLQPRPPHLNPQCFFYHLMTPVSSRPISSRPSTPAPSTSTPPPASAASSSAVPQVQPAFGDAGAVRETVRPGGGIFRPDGRHTLLGASKPAEQSSKPSSAEARAPPATLFAFTQQWGRLADPEQRWELLCQIPPRRLPVLFQTSLDASLLASFLQVFRAVLVAHPQDTERRAKVHTYMLHLARVPRFATVLLLLSRTERADVEAVWSTLGPGAQDEGEMEKKMEEGARRAWGV
ncbi:RNA polymerase II-associated protein 3 [Grifola frondosa]|uniref:RNA polymerase II-associated protein 3 n=1 Tax=Grifola frondosa TaxID=5627 RepID=A0A1C7M3Q8_GRIFR|nr:RNA polymerase II-associated protein 3 [Grifola frondosa]